MKLKLPFRTAAKRDIYILAAFILSLLFACVMLTQPTLCSPVNEERIKVDPEELEFHVRIISEEFFPRDYAHPENLDRAAAFIGGCFKEAGGEVSEQVYKADGLTYRNVIARFGPKTGEIIVVGAHYDSADELLAADDNASGVAGLIELGYLLGRTKPLPKGVELVAFTLEEPPYFSTDDMGSAVHARSLHDKSEKVRLMLSLECIGYFSDEEDSQDFPAKLLKLFYPDEGNFIAVVGKFGQGAAVRRVKKAMRAAAPLPVYSMNAPQSLPGIDFSDHRNYWKYGYTALMVTDTAFYRNKAYHTRFDTPERLDYKKMAMAVEEVYAAVMTEAGR